MEIRECACGCGNTFECEEKSKRRYYKNGCQNNLKKGNFKREIRNCACGCGETFECIPSKTKKYIRGHHLKGKTLAEAWGKETAERVKEKRIKRQKGKTWEQIMGKEKAQKCRERRAITRTGKKLNRTKPSYKKGRTAEDIYGKEKAKKINEKIKQKNIENGLYWTKEGILKAYKDLPDVRKIELRRYRKLKKIPDGNTIKIFFGFVDKMAVEAKKPFLKPLYKMNGGGHNEKAILDIIEKEKGIKLLRHRSILNSYPDGYDVINNVIYEVDEEYHQYRNQKIKDIKRDIKLKKFLNCKIIRINEKEFINSHLEQYPNSFIIR